MFHPEGGLPWDLLSSPPPQAFVDSAVIVLRITFPISMASGLYETTLTIILLLIASDLCYYTYLPLLGDSEASELNN